MFPSFNSKQDRENKRQALIEKIERDLEIDELKRQAYATTLWASDQDKNTLSLLKSKITLGTQTDGTNNTTTATSSSNNSSGSSNGNPPSIDPSVRSVVQDLVNNVIRSNASSSGTQTSSSVFSNSTQTSSNVASSSAQTEDIGDENESMSDIDDSEASPNAQKMQLSSRKWVEGLYKDHPELSTKGYNVIRFKNDLPDRNYILGKDAIVFNKLKGKAARSDIVASIDWLKTSEYIERMIEAHDREVADMDAKAHDMNLLREIADMMDEDKDAPYQPYPSGINYLKRKPKTQKRGLMEKKRGLVETFGSNSSSDTSNDQQQAYSDIFDLYTSNKSDLDRLGVNLIDKEQKMITGYTLMLNKPKTNLIIVKNSGGRRDHNPNVEKIVSWVYTLEYLVQRIAQINGNMRAPRQWNSQADHSLNTGISTQVNTANDSKQMIGQIHQLLPWIDTLDIKPVQIYKDGTRLSESYKFGDNLEIYTIKQNRRVSGKAKDDLMRQIDWGLTLKQIVEAVVAYDEFLDDYLSQSNVKRDNPSEYQQMETLRRNIGTAMDTLGIRRAYNKQGMGLKGRGLKGAGLKGYSNTSKNLRTIQGSGTASDLKYKQLGSKFIRITDLRLDQPRLKLVYANRTQVGRIIDISKPLAKCIEHLVFNQDVNQQMYNKLSINDKQVVHDLLRLCHLDTTFLNPISDPLEQLQAEFDKLRSQIMLGNDNPDNIRELKTLSLDLYNKKLINDDQMREILNLS